MGSSEWGEWDLEKVQVLSGDLWFKSAQKDSEQFIQYNNKVILSSSKDLCLFPRSPIASLMESEA